MQKGRVDVRPFAQNRRYATESVLIIYQPRRKPCSGARYTRRPRMSASQTEPNHFVQTTSRPHDPLRRLALPLALPIPIVRRILVVLQPRDPPPYAARGRRRGLAARRSRPALGGPSHRRDLSDPRRALGPLVERTVRARPESALRRQHALWIGFALTAGCSWFAPIVLLALARIPRHRRWEEQLLESRIGETYRDYVARVPRWFPARRWRRRRSHGDRPAKIAPAESFSWRETLFSERGTLIAIAVGTCCSGLKRP